MATIQSLISGINENKNEIASKLEAMGLTVANNKQLSDIADTAGAIYVDSETTEVKLGKGKNLVLKPGEYYKNEVTVAPNVAEKYYYEEAEITQSGTAYVSHRLDSTGAVTNAVSTTITAPQNYKFTNISNPVPSNVGGNYDYISGLSATAEISEDGKTATITILGKSNNVSGFADKELSTPVTYSFTAINEITTMGTPVSPSTEEQHFYADEGTVMTSFTVEAIPIENPEVSMENIITNKDGAGSSHSVSAPADGDKAQYMSAVNIPKVVIDSASVDYDQLYDGVEGTVTVKASENGCNGLSEVSIPKPEVKSATDSVDLLSAENADTHVTVNKGFYSDSTITIETAELYSELANI